MSYTDKIISELNSLITKNYDRENGYKEAAENAESPRLKSIFNDYAKQSYDFGHDIKAEIKNLGGTVEKGTSVAADLHRGWIDFKTFFTGNDDEAVLEECIRGEKNALNGYNEVLEDTNLSGSTRTMITKQRDAIQASLSRVSALEEAVD